MTALPLPAYSHEYTLDDWRRARAAQPDIRIELAEGSLIVIPTPPLGHAKVVARITAWLVRHGYPVDQVLSMVGVVTANASGRIPDLVLLRDDADDRTVDVSGASLRLVVEVESRSTRLTDRHIKTHEYARAGIDHYWRVERASDPDLPTLIDCLVLRKGAYHRYFQGTLDDLMADPPVFHDEAR